MADYAKLLKQSASRHPSALVIGNYFPDSFDPIIKDITASGIPVIISFAGGASWKEDGALGFVGVSGRDLGKSVAEVQIKGGAKHALCFNHVPANSTPTGTHKGASSMLPLSWRILSVLTRLEHNRL